MSNRTPVQIDFTHRMLVILSGARRVFAPRGVEGPAAAFLRGGAKQSLIFALFLFALVTIAAQQPESSSPIVLDRAVAVVNKHVILASDLDDEIRLSILDPNNASQGELTRQKALDQLISRALIQQQIRQEDMPALEPPPAEMNVRLHEIRTELPVCVRQNCASDAGWNAFLAAHGLTEQRVDAYLRYRLEILRFIEQRFRQGIQISQQQIDTYYHDTLLPQYTPGEAVPPLDQVAPRIQEILLQQQVDVLFDNWLTNLRQQGDVEVLDSNLVPNLVPNLAPNLVPEPAPEPASPPQTPASPNGAERKSP